MGERGRSTDPAVPESVGAAATELTVVAVAAPLPKDAREQLAQQLGPAFLVLDIRTAPRSTDLVIAPVVSPQTIGALKQQFPEARVIVAEISDSSWGVQLPGPVRRAVDAGADGYLVADTLQAVAAYVAAEDRPVLAAPAFGQLDVRRESLDQMVNELIELRQQVELGAGDRNDDISGDPTSA